MFLTDVAHGYIWHRFANRSASHNRAIASLAALPGPAFFSFFFFSFASLNRPLICISCHIHHLQYNTELQLEQNI